MTKQQELDRVTTWLVDASAGVSWEYFMLPVAGQETPSYRERVYCYELYHQWRCRWDGADQYILCGEVDKQGHPIIRCGAKPDFLIHSPGLMENLLAVEVKPSNARTSKMLKDLRTLTYFRRGLGDGQNYFAAYFLVYGIDGVGWSSLASKLVNHVQAERGIDLKLIRPAIHHREGERVEFVPWGDGTV